MRRTCPFVVAALVIAVPAGVRPQAISAPPIGTFIPTPWLEDFAQLRQAMSSHYANLEWAIDQRRMDLPRLRAETEAALQRAGDDLEARRILERFLDSFGDGHLEITWPKTPSTVAAAPPAGMCDRIGYGSRGGAGVGFSLLSGFSSVAGPGGQFFPGGLLPLSHGKTIGIVRIGVFTEKAYPEGCRQVVRQLGIADSVSCDSTCADRIDLRTADLLTAELMERVEELRRAGATGILVDITNNGGGSEWAEVLARALSSKPLRGSRLAFIKHEHWTTELSEALREVEADRHGSHGSDDALRRAAATLEQAVSASRERCDRQDVWNTGRLGCSLLVSDLLWSSGVLADARPGALAQFHSKASIFHPASYDYPEGRNRLPLFVLVDGGTWSAAEYFAALLQDNQAATILGGLTGGAGCGYTNGGIPTRLGHSNAEVRMPDCVRLRGDGSNEVNGVTPDMFVPWARRDSPYQRAQKARSVLEALR